MQRELKIILTDESLSDISNLSLLGGHDIKVKIHTHTSVGLQYIGNTLELELALQVIHWKLELVLQVIHWKLELAFQVDR